MTDLASKAFKIFKNFFSPTPVTGDQGHGHNPNQQQQPSSSHQFHSRKRRASPYDIYFRAELTDDDDDEETGVFSNIQNFGIPTKKKKFAALPLSRDAYSFGLNSQGMYTRSKESIENKRPSTFECGLQEYEPIAGHTAPKVSRMGTKSTNIENRISETYRSAPMSKFNSGYGNFSLNPTVPNFGVLKGMPNRDSATKSSYFPTATVSSVRHNREFGPSMSGRGIPNRTVEIVTLNGGNASVSDKSSTYKMDKGTNVAGLSRFSGTIAGNEKVSKAPISGGYPRLYWQNLFNRSKNTTSSVATRLEEKNEYMMLVGRIQDEQLVQYPKFSGISTGKYTKSSAPLLPAYYKTSGSPIFKSEIIYPKIEKKTSLTPNPLRKSHESHERIKKMFETFNSSDCEGEHENLSIPISTVSSAKYSTKLVGRKRTPHPNFLSRQKSDKELQLYSVQTRSTPKAIPLHGHQAKRLLHHFSDDGVKLTQSKPNDISPLGDEDVIVVVSSSASSLTSSGRSSTEVRSPESSENEKKSSDTDSDIVILAESIICRGPRRNSINSLELETLHSRYKDKSWLETLSASFKESQQRRLRQIDVEKKSMEILNSESDLSAELSKKIRNNLTITDIIVLEEQESGLPPMTDEMFGEVSRVMNSRNNAEVLATAFNIQITRGDLKTLAPCQWLNDNVINTYMDMIAERSRSEKGKLPSVHVFTTFFYPKFLKEGYSNVLKRWTRKVDIFSFDLLIFPIHLGIHWCLAVVDMRNQTIRYYDSLLGKQTMCVNALLKYLSFEMRERKKIELRSTDWKLELMSQIPTQENGSDCGVFTCKFGEYLSRDASLTFKQCDMEYYRHRMMYEIIRQDLLYP